MKITIQELSKSFGGRDIFSNFSLEVDSGVRLCVCGPNGTGKSTLLRLLAGVESPDGGRVLLPKGCRLGFVEQELSEQALDTPLLTFVLDVLHDWNDFWAEWEQAAESGDESRLTALMHRQSELEAMYGYNPEHRAKAVLSGLGFSEAKWGRTLRQLSGGWRERAKLARVLTAGSSYPSSTPEAIGAYLAEELALGDAEEAIGALTAQMNAGADAEEAELLHAAVTTLQMDVAARRVAHRALPAS